MRKNGELKLYFITTMTKLEDIKGYLETGATRTVGYYETWEDAEQCVLTNNCDIFEKELLNQFFLSFGTETTIYYIEDQKKYEQDEAYRSKLCFYSDNASAMRRNIWKQIPYPEVEFGEDQKWARIIIEKGYKKAYAPKSVIYHSHSYTFKQFYARYKEEGKSLYLIYHVKLVKGILDLVRKLPYHILNDFKYLLGKYRMRHLKLKDVFYWTYFSIGKNTARYFGLLAGVKEGVRLDD